MSDEASIGGRGGMKRQGVDPLIIFNSSSLEYVNNKKVTALREKIAYKRIPSKYK